jgi:hypothetical protein
MATAQSSASQINLFVYLLPDYNAAVSKVKRMDIDKLRGKYGF